MTRRVAILTPDPADRDFHSRWREVFAEEEALLRRAGLDVEGRAWVDDLDGFDLVLPLLVWGYHRAAPAWRDTMADWTARGLNVRNRPDILAWNIDKAYLGHLADRGAPVVPTRYVDRVDAAAMTAAAEAFGCDELIAKPQVSASAWKTIRWTAGASLDGAPEGPALIQPFLPTILGEGEPSLLYFDGAFSHAVAKQPSPGDFRVQPEHGGIISAYEAAADELAAAEKVMAAVGEDLLYARVDLCRDEHGTPLLMELELVEPDFFLKGDPRGGEAFVEAVLKALQH